MKQAKSGHLLPERLAEHLLFWPLLAVGLVAIYFMREWLRDILTPWGAAFAKWAVAIF